MRVFKGLLINDVDRNHDVVQKASTTKPRDDKNALYLVIGATGSIIAGTIGRVGLAIVEAIDNHERTLYQMGGRGAWREK